jgi:hypothetical protein
VESDFTCEFNSNNTTSDNSDVLCCFYLVVEFIKLSLSISNCDDTLRLDGRLVLEASSKYKDVIRKVSLALIS